ncbi:hypothetical protein WMY93_005241 [Mugilogobius chulae]|uniref:Coiled-coil domain containing 158 n=1 Tax=Mugilogobius chulae TaxID=88201 RepID=A0AAW0PQQ7_9GOBI
MNEAAGQQETLEDPLMEMLTELQRVQINKNISEHRLKDSKEHVKEMEKMLHLLEEVKITKMYGEQRLQKTEEDGILLDRKIGQLEKMLQKNHKQCTHKNTAITSKGKRTILKQKGNIIHLLQIKLIKNQKNKIIQINCIVTLIDCIDQEMAVLAEKLSFFSSSSVSLITKLELLKKLVEKQSLYDAQVTEIKTTLSSHEQNFNFLEEDLTCLQIQLLNVLLEQKTQEEKQSQELLAKETSIESQTSDSDSQIKLKHNIQQADQYRRTSENLLQDIHLLNKQLNHLKVDILHLRTEFDHYKSCLADVDHNKHKLQVSEVEHSRHDQEEILAKQQLSINLETQDMQLRNLTEKHKELQLLYSCMNKEKEGVILQLQIHLKNVQRELEEAKSTLRTLEHKDNNGLQMAQCMQKKITDKRQLIDSLDSKILILEETNKKLCEEKLQQNFENKRQFHELALVRTEKKHLAKELEDAKLRNKYLSEQLNELETVFHKLDILIAFFIDCQKIIQQQDQKPFHLNPNLGLQEEGPLSDIGSQPFKEQDGRKKHRLHIVDTSGDSVCRRGTTSDRQHSSAFESHHHIAKLKKIVQHNVFNEEPLTSSETMTSPQLFGRRSPVHILLTSDLNS